MACGGRWHVQRIRGENGEPTCATLNERAKASLPSPFSRHLESTPGGSGRLPVGARRGKSCRPSHATHHRPRPCPFRPSASACARTHEDEEDWERGQGFLLFASLLFILLIKRSHLLRRGFAPTAPLKPAASATREILMVQSQHSCTGSSGDEISGWGRRWAPSLLQSSLP